MPFKSYRDESRVDYGRHKDANDGMTEDELKVGALLRIADATELMARDRVQMEAALDYNRRRKEELSAQLATERRRTAALRGVIARMKRDNCDAHRGATEAAEARVAELEASNAALVAERHEAISNYHTTLESLVGIMDEVSARFFDSDSRREWKERRHLYTSIIERKKEAPDAE